MPCDVRSAALPLSWLGISILPAIRGSDLDSQQKLSPNSVSEEKRCVGEAKTDENLQINLQKWTQWLESTQTFQTYLNILDKKIHPIWRQLIHLIE